MQPRDDSHLVDILEAANLAAEFVAGADRQAFDANRMMQRAILYQLAIIGEACNRLSPEFRAGRPEIPWREIVGMRNILIHQYGSVDLELAWAAATRRAPDLAERVTRILDELK